jgi:outer membrane protein assembly factor BamB
MRGSLLALWFNCSLWLWALPQATAIEPADAADEIMQIAAIDRGICTLVGGDDGAFVGRLATELAWGEGLIVHVWNPSFDVAHEARQIAIDEDMHGTRVIVEHGRLERLPYADNTVDVLVAVADDTTAQLAIDEVLRVLRPDGRAVFGTEQSAEALQDWLEQRGVRGAELHETANAHYATTSKPRPAGEGDWSHIEHGPDNNPVADDALIKAPYMTKWLGTPYYIAMPAITVSADGRIFLATGHIAHHEREEPWLNTLIARNGYNGTVLWQRKLPDNYLVHRSAFIATADILYMIEPDGSGCLAVDARTGEERGRIEAPGRRGQWKWMAIQDGVLLALIGGEKDPAETTIVRSDRTHWSWGDLSPGYYPDRIPWGFGQKIVAIDLASRKAIWQHREKTDIDSRGMVTGGGRVFYYCADAMLGCLDLATGEPVWTNPDEEVRKLIEEKGRGLSSTPGFRTMTFSLYTPDVLVYQGQTRQNVVAVSTKYGTMLWNRQKTTNNPNAISVDNNLILGIGEQGSSLLIDPESGETLGDLGFAKRSCARLTATSDSLFCRGMPEGLTRFDLNTKQVAFNGAVRPSCNDGVVAANGLLYMGPWACDCNLSLMGRVVMCSAGDFDFKRQGASEPESLSAANGVTPLTTDDADWSTYRGNTARSASTPVDVPRDVGKLWTFAPRSKVGLTAATTAGENIFVAGDDGAVRAIDATTGRLKWEYYTAGPVHQSPTIADGRAYFGSGDGYVYCLEAVTGRAIWRYRVAPMERRIPVYGSLSSTWPVHSGVLVEDGVAFAAAGIIDYDGTYVCALDAETGERVWENGETGHLDPLLRKGVSAQGFLTTAAGRLWMAGGNVISPASYDLRTGEYRGRKPDDGSPRTNRGEEIGTFAGDHIIIGGRLRFSATKNVVNPGYFSAHAIDGEGADSELRIQEGKIPPAWNDDHVVVVPGLGSIPMWLDVDRLADSLDAGSVDKARRRGQLDPQATAESLKDADTVAVALAADAVLAVSQKNVARNGQGQWVASAFDLANGDVIWQQKLPSAAIPGGLSVDREGRVVVVLEEGRVICLGSGELLAASLEQMVDTVENGETDRAAVLPQIQAALAEANTPEMIELSLAMLKRLGVDIVAEAKMRGSIAHWRLLSPLPWNDEHPIDAPLAGEPDVDPSATVTFGDRRLSWRPVRSIDRDGKVDLVSLYGSKPDMAAYAYAEFTLPLAQDVVLRLGSNDGFICWLNGEEVARYDGGRGYVPDQDEIPVKATAGVNSVLLKITQMGGSWAYGVRVTDMDGVGVEFEQ